jgi:hypothetical protein
MRMSRNTPVEAVVSSHRGPLMTQAFANTTPRLDPRKFQDPLVTARGERRAHVALKALETLWFNTGTLCNLTCQNCYIESSPKNDRLAYLTAAEVHPLSRRDRAAAARTET